MFRFAVLVLLSLSALSPYAHAHSADGGIQSGPYSVEIRDESGALLPTFNHRGRFYVLGSHGQRYRIHVRNASARRIEVVTSVDGRDVMDGRPAHLSKRGYILGPYESMAIDGYRLNMQSVAAFRFGSVAQSYAAQMGNARDVGVIGVAIFTERQPPRSPRPMPYSSLNDREDLGRGAPREEAVPAPPSAEKSAPNRSEGLASSNADASSESVAQGKGRAAERPGLGTEFGEERHSQVYSTHFLRASSTPETVLSLRYNDKPGLLALGVDVDGRHRPSDLWQRETAEPFRKNLSFARPPPGWRNASHR